MSRHLNLVRRMRAEREAGVNPLEAMKRVAEERSAAGEGMLAKLNKITKKNTDRKKARKTNEHKREWLQEWQAIHKQMVAVESELGDIWVNMCTPRPSDPTFPTTELRELMNHSSKLREERAKEQRRCNIRTQRAQVAIRKARTASDKQSAMRGLKGEKESQERLYAELREQERLLTTYLERFMSNLSQQGGRSGAVTSRPGSRLSSARSHRSAPSPRPSSAGTVMTSGLQRSPSLASIGEIVVDIADPDLRERYIELFSALDDLFNERLAGIKTELLDACPTMTADDVLSKTGGWNADDHFHFKKIYDDYQGKKKSRQQLMERLQLELRKYSQKKISVHVDWHRLLTGYKLRRRDLITAWTRQREELRLKAIDHDKRRRAQAESDYQLAIERLQTELAQERQHGELEELRSARIAKLEEALTSATAEAEHAQEAADRKAALAAERQEELRLLVDDYQHQRAEEEAKIADAEREAAEQAEAERRANIIANKPRVAARHDAEWARIQAKLDLEEARRLEEEEREDAKARLKAQVESGVEHDPTRVTRGTESWLAEKNALTAARQRQTGYTDDQVLADPRVRLSLALAAVGLDKTDYGRGQIAAAPGATAPRIDSFDFAQIHGTGISESRGRLK